MKYFIVLVLFLLVFSSCKKEEASLTSKVAGIYYGRTSTGSGANGVPSSSSSPDTITILTVDETKISILRNEFLLNESNFLSEDSIQYNFGCASLYYHECYVKFDKSFHRMEYYTQGPGQIASSYFVGTK